MPNKVIGRIEKIYEQCIKLTGLNWMEFRNGLYVEILLNHFALFTELVAVWKKPEGVLPAHPRLYMLMTAAVVVLRSSDSSPCITLRGLSE